MIELLPDFKFVVVWECSKVGEKIEDFLNFGLEHLHCRIQYLGDIAIPFFNDRWDVIFAVHKDDIWSFFYNRPRFEMKWLEEALRATPELYPAYLESYRRY